ncbi:tail fiber protein [Pseudoalteromonas sp. MM17-2]|uniref:phage tail protein n=1 Tax=unclassified Pseudoalteromonas TaxID=194690 RepID=UPI001022BF76|nr:MULTISPECIES: tail fiber protein [unclassified Pseudoalteromonas]MCG7545051.1 tail fiber protein [Pseudoalteromonas sp. MM17-2]RZF87401.1 phage tail protein [Pseudoalteromonas sp. CO325X]
MEAFLGQIQPFGFNFAPRGWALCAGQLLAISSNTALFSLLGTNYGGDGRTTYGLPDLRGRTAVGEGNHPGSQFNWRMGETHGAERHTLNVTELPQHSFTAALTNVTGTLMATTADGTTETPQDGYILAKTIPGESRGDDPEKIYAPANSGSNVNLAGVSVSGTASITSPGGNQSFSILQPTLGVNYSIAEVGIFPSRN